MSLQSIANLQPSTQQQNRVYNLHVYKMRADVLESPSAELNTLTVDTLNYTTLNPVIPVGSFSLSRSFISDFAATGEFINVDSTISNEFIASFQVSETYNIKNVFYKVAIAPGAGESTAIVVRKNASNTSLLVEITDDDTSANNLSDVINCVPGDLISFQLTVSSGAAASNAIFSVAFESA